MPIGPGVIGVVASLVGKLHGNPLGRPHRLVHPGVGLRLGHPLTANPVGLAVAIAIPIRIRGQSEIVIRLTRVAGGSVGQRTMRELANRSRDLMHGSGAMALVIVIDSGERAVDRPEP